LDRAAHLGVEFSNGDIGLSPAAQMQKDVFRSNNSASSTVTSTRTALSRALSGESERMTIDGEGCVDSVDGSDEALLAGNHQTQRRTPLETAMAQQDSGERHDADHQNSKEDSILNGIAVRRRGDE